MCSDVKFLTYYLASFPVLLSHSVLYTLCFTVFCSVLQFWSETNSSTTGTDPRDKICSDVMKRKEVKSRWCKTEILVIDEISMLSAEMFDILSFIGENSANSPHALVSPVVWVSEVDVN